MRKLKGVERRGKVTRSRNPIILFATEGNNKTEELYLKNFRERTAPRLIPADRNVTDPVNMMNQLIKQADEMDLSVDLGDKAYCIIDTDTDRSKQAQIDIACSKQTDLVQVITSSPCFEEWFLCHFRMSTGYQTSSDAISELRAFIPGYEKSNDVFSQIQIKTNDAIKNAKRLEQYHQQEGRKIQTVESNPSTEVYKIVEFITNARSK